jgi:polyhydroxyalkanoate synthesis regulator phasin
MDRNSGDTQAQTDRIKKMVEQGKITKEEAERLIEVLVKSAESQNNKKEKKGE